MILKKEKWLLIRTVSIAANRYSHIIAMKMKTKSRQLSQSRQSKQSRQANLMTAIAVTAAFYFIVWTLIGLIL